MVRNLDSSESEMVEERKKSETRVDSEETIEEVVAEHGSMKKEKKKKKSRENKDSFAGEDGEIAEYEREKLGDDGVVKKKSKKKRVDPEAKDDVKKSKKKNKEKRADSDPEAEDGLNKSKKKSEEKKADPKAEDSVKKSKKKNKEIRVDPEADNVGKKESGSDDIGNIEGNQKDEKPLVNTDIGEKKTGKRKRDDSNLGAEENTNKEMKRKSKKKKPSVVPEVEENNKDSMKDAKKKSKEKRQSDDPEVEENNKDSTKDAVKEKKKEKKQSVDSEVEENDLNSTKDAKKKGKKKMQSDEEAGENNNDGTKDAEKKRKKNQKCSKSDEDVTTPSSKSTKKVKFSDQVEVFPTDDKESEDEVEKEEVELVRGKRFTKEEDDLVKKAVLEYIDNHALGDEGLKMVMDCKSYPQVKGCWKEIESALPWRTKSSVYHRAHNLFESGSKGIWTKEDLELVKQFQAKHGNDWRTLADAMGKHRVHVKDAWRRIRFNMNKGHWSREEYQTLFDLVNTDLRMKAFQEKHSRHGMLRDNIPWMAISDELGTRDHALCCLKWYDQLQSPMVAKGIWANVDDYRLLDELTKLDAACIDDVDWDNLLENRDGEACRKRWNQMVLHIGSPRTKTFTEQVEILSQRYCPDLAEDREDFDNRPFDPED